MECIYRQYSYWFFFCVLYNISESLSRFWFYVSHNFGFLVTLISLLSHDFSSQFPYLCYLPKILVPICVSSKFLGGREGVVDGEGVAVKDV